VRAEEARRLGFESAMIGSAALAVHGYARGADLQASRAAAAEFDSKGQLVALIASARALTL
jgi:hypothetical protein